MRGRGSPGRHPANLFWEAIRSGASSIEPVGAADLEVAWANSAAFDDQDFSIVVR